ncbi:MAG: DUF4239 domain-containing protein [Undibacterium sp.]|nr:DUF4239 domain-containing protein [Opitutaceae bacterium]
MIATLHLHAFRELPQWQFCLFVIVVFMVVAVGGQIATRPLLRRWFGDRDHNETVAHYISAFGVLYGITLGLISVAAWENFGDVEGKVSTEAASLASLYRNVDCYPEPKRTELTGMLRDYTRHVIDVSWPEMQRGVAPTGSHAFVRKFQWALVAFEPATEAQIALHRESLYRFTGMVEARRLRLDCVAWQLPTILWVVVLAGSFMSFVLTWLIVPESRLLHDILTGIMAILLGLLIFFLATLDLPFEGSNSVGPDSLELVYEQVMAPH